MKEAFMTCEMAADICRSHENCEECSLYGSDRCLVYEKLTSINVDYQVTVANASGEVITYNLSGRANEDSVWASEKTCPLNNEHVGEVFLEDFETHHTITVRLYPIREDFSTFGEYDECAGDCHTESYTLPAGLIIAVNQKGE